MGPPPPSIVGDILSLRGASASRRRPLQGPAIEIDPKPRHKPPAVLLRKTPLLAPSLAWSLFSNTQRPQLQSKTAALSFTDRRRRGSRLRVAIIHRSFRPAAMNPRTPPLHASSMRRDAATIRRSCPAVCSAPSASPSCSNVEPAHPGAANSASGTFAGVPFFPPLPCQRIGASASSSPVQKITSVNSTTKHALLPAIVRRSSASRQ